MSSNHILQKSMYLKFSNDIESLYKDSNFVFERVYEVVKTIYSVLTEGRSVTSDELIYITQYNGGADYFSHFREGRTYISYEIYGNHRYAIEDIYLEDKPYQITRKFPVRWLYEDFEPELIAAVEKAKLEQEQLRIKNEQIANQFASRRARVLEAIKHSGLTEEDLKGLIF
jgi:hypothetical protein